MSRSAVSTELIERCVHHLEGEYLPRLERALAVLPPEDLWWKPHGETTSVGNLLLHLEGNVRQWILSGLGDHPDDRDRASEFTASASPESRSGDKLMAALRMTVERACAVIAELDDDALLRSRTIQIFEGVSGLAALVHVVEHFAWHTGQITHIAKLRAGERHGLAYYDDERLQGE